MKIYKLLVLIGALAILGGCGLLGSDSSEDTLSSTEDPTAEPTLASAQAVAVDTQIAVEAATEPTPVTIPATPVPPTPTPDRSVPTTHVVQAGEVLGLIAEQYGVDIAELRSVNGLNGNVIQVGQQLTIPAATGQASDLSLDSGSPAPTPVPVPTPALVSCPEGAVGHCVQPGETISEIALQYDITVDALRSANPSIQNDIIMVGSVLALPGQNSGDSEAPSENPGTPANGDSDPSAPTPLTDADCAARNASYPYVHDGLCYANPIRGSTAAEPTPTPSATCDEGYFLFTDGLCYPTPGQPTPTPTVAATATPSTQTDARYGRPPCREGYVELVTTNVCWPKPETTPATVTPVPASS